MTTTQEQDWRSAYRSLTPEQQEQEQLTSAPVLPKGKSNSFNLLSLYSFSNECHDEKGRFCGDGEGSGKVEGDKPAREKQSPVPNFGFESWPAGRKNEILNQVAALRNKYPVEQYAIMSVNAGGDRRTNAAILTQSLAAVDQGIPTHIDVNPQMKSQAWLKENDPGTTVSTGNLADVITHEFGHVIEGVMPPKLVKEMQAPFLKAIEDGFDLEDGKSDGAVFKDLVSKVSEYATDNPSEGIAEAFLQHEKGIHNEYSDHVGAVIEKWKAGIK